MLCFQGGKAAKPTKTLRKEASASEVSALKLQNCKENLQPGLSKGCCSSAVLVVF